MTPPRVWAPAAHSLELLHRRARTPMRRQAGGWWQASRALVHGEDYAFSCNGGPARPDPQSRWQPLGVHGASRCFDASRFRWSDAGWRPPAWPGAVLYELHIGTFSPAGTFAGAIARLPHLVRLGVTHVEVMPIAEFPGTRGWGYDGVDLFAPHHAYGGPAGFQQFVNACHAHGLAVLLDVVYNHLGPDGNYLAEFGPYFTARYHTPWGAAVNFDGPGSDGVRAFFLANARQWLLDFHCDGLRLDAVHAICDNSAFPFLEELAQNVRAWSAECGREMVLVAESDANDARLSLAAEVGGLGLRAQWNEDFHHALHAALTGERLGYFADFGPLAALAATLRRGFWLDGRVSRYRGRRHGRPLAASDGSRLVVYAQNHDQTGNRAQGERLSQLLPPHLLFVAAALTLLAPQVPLVFQGEEWGAGTPFLYFTDHYDAALAAAVRSGRRRECAHFGWPGTNPDPQARATFARSRLRWAELGEPAHAALLDWYRRLIRLRRTTSLGVPDLAAVRVRYSERHRWLLMARGGWRTACNLAPVAQAVPLGVALASGWRLEMASSPPLALQTAAASLAPESAAIFRPPGPAC